MNARPTACGEGRNNGGTQWKVVAAHQSTSSAVTDNTLSPNALPYPGKR